MTRVLQLMAGARHGGAEAFFERLAIALHAAAIPQRVAIRPYPERLARLRAGGLDPVEVPFGGVLDFRTRAALRRLVARFEPQLVLSWMSRATRFRPPGRFVHAARLGGYYDIKYFRGCDHLIGNTRGIVSYLRRQGWPAERAHYLPNFVSLAPTLPLPKDHAGTPPDAMVALALGRLHRNKGFDILLPALVATPGVHLWLAGEGPERGALEAQARELGIENRVRFLGWRDDVPGLLAAADLFVCSSRHEPLGNVVIEAWAAGVPVVAAASAGPAELICDQESGLLVPVEDAAALGAAMNRVAAEDGLRVRLVEAGRAAYEAEFREERVVALYQEFFARVTR